MLAVSTGAALLGLGALFSGMASMITAVAGIRKVKREAVDECDKRIKQINKAFAAGMRVMPRTESRDMRPEEDERWSHLP